MNVRPQRVVAPDESNGTLQTFPTRCEGMEAEAKRKKNKKSFWYPTQGPGLIISGPNASGWQLLEPISPFSVFNSVQLSQQSFHPDVWHLLDKIFDSYERSWITAKHERDQGLKFKCTGSYFECLIISSQLQLLSIELNAQSTPQIESDLI